MAAERTWLAWWRTALAATPSSSGARPYVLLGIGYAAIAMGLLLMGAIRQRDLERALATGSRAPLSFGLVALFTGGGVALALTTVVLIVAQT